MLVLSASIDEIKANAGSPVIELFSFDHVFPPSVVSWTFPSSVPTQTMFSSRGDSEIVNIVVLFSAVLLSIVSPPDFS